MTDLLARSATAPLASAIVWTIVAIWVLFAAAVRSKRNAHRLQRPRLFRVDNTGAR